MQNIFEEQTKFETLIKMSLIHCLKLHMYVVRANTTQNFDHKIQLDLRIKITTTNMIPTSRIYCFRIEEKNTVLIK